LDLFDAVFGPAGVGWLARSPIWRGLTRLALSDGLYAGDENVPFLGDAAAAALADSSSLENLHFCACTLGPKGAWALAGRDFPRLEALDLPFNRMGDEGFGHLLSRGGFPRLARLNVQATGLTATSMRALAGSPLLDRLTELELVENQIGDEGASALAASPRISQLRQLNMGGCGIGEKGARALVASPYLNRLQWLNLYDTPIRLPQHGSTAERLVRRFGKRVRF
jgi:hypothetical protein